MAVVVLHCEQPRLLVSLCPPLQGKAEVAGIADRGGELLPGLSSDSIP